MEDCHLPFSAHPDRFSGQRTPTEKKSAVLFIVLFLRLGRVLGSSLPATFSVRNGRVCAGLGITSWISSPSIIVEAGNSAQPIGECDDTDLSVVRLC